MSIIIEKENNLIKLKHPILINETLLNQLQVEIEDWSISHGLIMFNKEKNKLIHAPITLLPTPFPRYCFEKIWKLGPG